VLLVFHGFFFYVKNSRLLAPGHHAAVITDSTATCASLGKEVKSRENYVSASAVQFCTSHCTDISCVLPQALTSRVTKIKFFHN